MSSFYELSREYIPNYEFQNESGPSIVALRVDDFDNGQEYEGGESLEDFQKPLEPILDYGLYLRKGDKNYEDYEEDYAPYRTRHQIRYELIKFEAAGGSFKDSDREEIIEKLKELQQDANVLAVKNRFLHRQYINFMKNNLGSSALDKFDEVTVFEDPRYITELDDYTQLRDEVHEKDANLTTKLNDLKENYVKAVADFEETFENLTTTEFEVGKKIKPLHSDKKAWNDQLRQMLENQRHHVNIVAKIRMTYLILRQRLLKLQGRNSPSLGSGFTVLDYEFLLKKKSVYLEKLDEQNDHIGKFEHKVLATAASIKHVDEESELYTERVKNAIERLLVITDENSCEHHKFVKLAKKRALTFKSILKLRETIGLLGIPFCINKMEYDIIEHQKLKKKLENMEMKMIIDTNR